MSRILVTDGMDKNALAELRELGNEVVEQFYEADELKEELKQFDVVVIRSATKVGKEIIDAALETKRLSIIIRGGVGIDNIDVEYAKDKAIKVFNTPNASSGAVAELTIGHMFALARNIHIANVTMRNGEWNKNEYKGIELSGKTLGLFGFGRIAIETAKKARALGMKVLYNNTSGKKDGYDEYIYVSKEELLKKSDFISLHLPFKKGDTPIIGEQEISSMKNSAYIINTARGGVVDEEALIKAINEGKLAGAALDVYKEEPTKNEELYKNPKISVTPHIGGSTKECQSKIGQEIVQIIKDNL